MKIKNARYEPGAFLAYRTFRVGFNADGAR